MALAGTSLLFFSFSYLFRSFGVMGWLWINDFAWIWVWCCNVVFSEIPVVLYLLLFCMHWGTVLFSSSVFLLAMCYRGLNNFIVLWLCSVLKNFPFLCPYLMCLIDDRKSCSAAFFFFSFFAFAFIGYHSNFFYFINYCEVFVFEVCLRSNFEFW